MLVACASRISVPKASRPLNHHHNNNKKLSLLLSLPPPLRPRKTLIIINSSLPSSSTPQRPLLHPHPPLHEYAQDSQLQHRPPLRNFVVHEDAQHVGQRKRLHDEKSEQKKIELEQTKLELEESGQQEKDPELQRRPLLQDLVVHEDADERQQEKLYEKELEQKNLHEEEGSKHWQQQEQRLLLRNRVVDKNEEGSPEQQRILLPYDSGERADGDDPKNQRVSQRGIAVQEEERESEQQSVLQQVATVREDEEALEHRNSPLDEDNDESEHQKLQSGARRLDSHGKIVDEREESTTSAEEEEDMPLVKALKACAGQNVAAFHFPGHGRGAAAPTSLTRLLGMGPFAHDLPELPELDNLFAPEGAIAEAQEKAASLFGAESTYFLVGGSTCGIQAAVMATCSADQVLILPRNCHVSAISALVLSGASPAYLMPTYDSRWDIAHGIDPEAVEAALEEMEGENRKVGAVLITSPTYFGVCSDVREIARICHEHRTPLIVDEAHGAHFPFHPELPETALEQGADLVVQSTHKVLSSFTQSAMLHVRGGEVVQKEMLGRCLQMIQSSSPNYLLLASLDAARMQLSSSEKPFDKALQLALAVREALTDIPGLHVLGRESIREIDNGSAVAIDPLRITVGLWGLGLSGFEADDVLRMEYQVVAELPSLHSITFAVNLGTSLQDVNRLFEAFQSLSRIHHSTACRKSLPSFALSSTGTLPQQMAALSPREAFFAATERRKAEDAVGCISAELICPYPPGIPVIVPGEVVSQEALTYLREIVQKGGIISGASDPSLTSILTCRNRC